ncbi:hypothetical protein HZC21_02495, partial [Candidatus Peregrinibacteria bacterium]|nr:hypothetical protein [Candidatus Peregrinibacteria bacterium]
MQTEISLLFVVGLVISGIAFGYFLRLAIAKRIGASLEHKIKADREVAKSEANQIVLAAQEKAATILADAQREDRERKQEVRRLEERLLKKED